MRNYTIKGNLPGALTQTLGTFRASSASHAVIKALAAAHRIGVCGYVNVTVTPA